MNKDKIDYSYLKFSKPNHNRGKEKRVKRSRFTQKTILEIFERDNNRCIKCGSTGPLETIPHHIIFRSQMGKGTKSNGATICRSCHDEAHDSKEVRKWFEEWAKRTLDEDGNYKIPDFE